MKTSIIQHPDKDPFVMIRNGYKQLCGGDTCKAGVLALVEFWANGIVIHRKRGNKKGGKDEVIIPPENKLIFLGARSKPEWEKGMLNLYSAKWIMRAVKSLVRCGILLVQAKPGKASMYWVNPSRIQQALDYHKNVIHGISTKDPLSQIAQKLGWGKSDYTESDLNNAFFGVSEQPGNYYPTPQGKVVIPQKNYPTTGEVLPCDPGKISPVSRPRIIYNNNIYNIYNLRYNLRKELKIKRKKTQDQTRTRVREKNPDLCVCKKNNTVATKVKDSEIIQAQVEVLQSEPEGLQAQVEVLQSEPEGLQAQVEVLQSEPEVMQTDSQVEKQAQSLLVQNKKNLGQDQSSGARDNKVFGIPIAKLEEIADKFDRGEIYAIPDRELKALAQLRIGEYVKLYRKSGLVASSKPNDIKLEFATWFAWHQKGEEGEVQFALNTIAKYERKPDKWQVLTIAVQQWQEFRANPELIERKAEQRQGKNSSNSEIDSQIRASKLENLAHQKRARRATKTTKQGNVPGIPQPTTTEAQRGYTDNNGGNAQSQCEEIRGEAQERNQEKEFTPMPDSLRQRLDVIRKEKGIGSRREQSSSVIPIRFDRSEADYGGFDF